MAIGSLAAMVVLPLCLAYLRDHDQAELHACWLIVATAVLAYALGADLSSDDPPFER